MLCQGHSMVGSSKEGWPLIGKPELAATLRSCMQSMLHSLKAGLEGQPNVTPAS
jgi:hypothetical protein